MAASKRERVGILIAAVLFFAASFGSTALVLWQASQPEDDSAVTQTAESTNENKEDTLEGTKLADYTPVDKVEELESIDIKVGTGAEAQPGDTVTAHYTGALAKNGTIFQSSHDFGEAIAFSLDRVIQGWKEGVPGMKEGGTRRLIIPAGMAYGDAGSPPAIGPNEPLVFDIELVKVGE